VARLKRQPVTLLIDADVLAYNAANNEQRVTDWGDGVVSVVMGELELGVQRVLDTAEHYLRELKADKYVLCLTHPVQFRKQMLATYKGNRSVKPVLVDPIRDQLVEKYKGVRRPLLEGDDVMGIYATHPALIPGKKIIVSIDKDMAQIPGTLYNPGKQTLVDITLEEADHLHMMQTLTGDPTDNYKGCPGIGPVKAEAILRDADDHAEPFEPEIAVARWNAIVAAYEAKGLTEADALLQARMARILRHTDFNFKTKEPILWEPARPLSKNPSPSRSRSTSTATHAASALQSVTATSTSSTRTTPTRSSTSASSTRASTRSAKPSP
jgi:DNA polymerase-1